MSQQNENGGGGRDASERFVKENRFGPGSPFGLRVAALVNKETRNGDADRFSIPKKPMTQEEWRVWMESMAGTWQGSFERMPQGEYEERVPLA